MSPDKKRKKLVASVLRFAAKRPQASAPAKFALETSAHAPNSGFAFVDNSQGASAAVTELSNSLEGAFEKLDYESECFNSTVGTVLSAVNNHRASE
jgi:hypothetical protein